MALPRRSSAGAVFAASALAIVLAVCCFRCALDSGAAFVGVGRPMHVASQRQLGVSRRAVDKALKERIESVTKTGKLTDSMRLVAAAKVRQAQNGVQKSRPFSNELTAMIKGLTKRLKGTGLEAELPMLRVPEKVQNVAILYIASNRGLCGGYNSLTGKRVGERVEQLNAQGIAPKIVIVGTKAKRQIERRCDGMQYTITDKAFGFPDKLDSKFASEVGDTLRNMFLSGEVDKVEIVYAKFINLLTNTATLRSILPLSPTGIEDPQDEIFSLTTSGGKLSVEREKVKAAKAKDIENDVIFDQPPDVILNSMLPLYLNSQLLSLFYEAQASELSSRMNAMKAASDNAIDIAKALTIVYNKKRQAAITQEILEICNGAAAVEEGDAKGVQPLGLFDSVETISDDFLSDMDSGSATDDNIVDFSEKYPQEWLADIDQIGGEAMAD